MVPIDRMREILTLLEGPDPDSRSSAEDGRRIVKQEGGWQIVNYSKYRQARSEEDRRDYQRHWDKENRPHRERNPTQPDTTRHNPTNPTKAEAEAELEANDQKQEHVPQTARFDEFWSIYPIKREKKKARDKWKAKRLDAIADQLIADVRNRIKSDEQWLRGFAPHATTYLNGERWEDELSGRANARAGPQHQPGKQFQGIQAIQRLRDEYRNDERPDSDANAAVDVPRLGGPAVR